MSEQGNDKEKAAESSGQEIYANADEHGTETIVLDKDGKPPIVEAAPTETKVEAKPIDKEGLADRKSPDDESLGPVPTMDDFNALKEGAQPFADKSKFTKEEKGKAPTPTPEDKKITATPANKETIKEEQRKLETTSAAAKVERDYTGLDEQEAKLLKNTSNEAFAWLRPTLLEKKKLSEVLRKKDEEISNLKSGKQILPDSYYEHPQAFVLDNTYNNLSRDLNIASGIENHWKSQLANIRRGEPWKMLTSNERGQFVTSAPQKATPEAEADVLAYINHAASQTADVQRKVVHFQQEFKGRHSQAVTALRNVEKEKFSVYDDPNHPMQPTIKNIMGMIPREFQGNPLASLTAKSAAAAIQLSQLVQARDVDIVKLKEEIAELKKGPDKGRVRTPSEGDITNAGSKGGNKAGEKDVTIDDFNALKR